MRQVTHRYWHRCLIAALVIIGSVSCSKPEKTQAVVESVAWERVIILERRIVYTMENWVDLLPSDAYDLACESRKFGTEKCNPSSCLELNWELELELSTCYDTCDVMKDWCACRYDEWPEARRSTASGGGPNAVWPTDIKAQGADERLAHSETYTVVFAKSTGAKPRHLTYQAQSYDDYMRFVLDRHWEIEIHGGTRVVPKQIIRAEKE